MAAQPNQQLLPSTTPRSPTGRSSSHGYQPLCFHKDIFSSHNFNVDGFIADCRKRVPLESVRNDLRDYFTSLENELVELINKDYTDFVNLSGNLSGIDEDLNNLREPLNEIKLDAKAFNERVQGLIESTELKMKERQDVIAKKQYLQLFMSISASMDKLDHLLSIGHKSTSQTTTSTTAHGATSIHSDRLTTSIYIDRLANEYNTLSFYLLTAQTWKGKVTLLGHFSQKTTALEQALDQEVSKCFRSAIAASSSELSHASLNHTTSTVGTTSNTPSNHFSGTPPSNHSSNTSSSHSSHSPVELVGPCCRLYSALNKTSSAYSIYREVVVKPRVQQIVTASNLGRGTCEGLKGIFDSLLEFIQSECCPFLLTIREITGSKYDFLSNSIWIEIEEAIYTRIGKIYAPGIPEIFHQNYKTCFAFLSQLETLTCHSLDALLTFRAHASYLAFERRWNTSVYFQLRFTEIASKVEAALSQQQQLITPSSTHEPTFLLHGSVVLWRELVRIWSPNVFLYELTRQFAKLTFQLLSRYSSWVYASYATPSTTPSTPTPSGEPLKNSITLNLTENVDEPAVAFWSKLVPDIYAYIYHDLVTIVSNVGVDMGATPGQETTLKGKGLLSVILSALQQEGGSIDDVLVSALREPLTAATSSLLIHQTHLSNAITSNLTKKAIDSLQPLLGVTATYRLTDKRLPTRANYYVDDVVRCLQAFLQQQSLPLSQQSQAQAQTQAQSQSQAQAQISAQAQKQQPHSLPLPIRQEWLRKVLTDATIRYEEMVAETLNNAHKAEALLSRVVKKKASTQGQGGSGGAGAGGGGGGGISDIDKISLQLYLDVTHYGQLLKTNLNIEATNFPPYNNLLARVADGARFKNLVTESVQ